MNEADLALHFLLKQEGASSKQEQAKRILNSIKSDWVYYRATGLYKINTEALRLCAAIKMVSGRGMLSGYAEAVSKKWLKKFRASFTAGEAYAWTSYIPVGFKSKTELIVYKLYADCVCVIDVSDIEELICGYDFDYYEKYSLKMHMLGSQEKLACINGEVYGKKAPFMLDVNLLKKNDFTGIKGIQGECKYFGNDYKPIELKEKLMITDLVLCGCDVKIHDCKRVGINSIEAGKLEIFKAQAVNLYKMSNCMVTLHKDVEYCYIYIDNPMTGNDKVRINVGCLFENIELFTIEYFNIDRKYTMIFDSTYPFSTHESMEAALEFEEKHGEDSLQMTDDVGGYYEERKKEILGEFRSLSALRRIKGFKEEDNET